MVGNDVVDLTDPQCLPMGTHARFDERVFVPSERRMMQASAAPARLRWLLWAAKESGYKLMRKRDPALTFVPRRFVVALRGAAAARDRSCGRAPRGHVLLGGTITCGGHCVAFHGVSDGDALHVVARGDEPGVFDLLTAVAAAPPVEPGLAVRRLVCAAVADRLGVPVEALCVVRQDRIPHLQLRGAPLPIDLSLSHHGRFVGYAALMPCPGGGR
jgi:hypothetical protein